MIPHEAPSSHPAQGVVDCYVNNKITPSYPRTYSRSSTGTYIQHNIYNRHRHDTNKYAKSLIHYWYTHTSRSFFGSLLDKFCLTEQRASFSLLFLRIRHALPPMMRYTMDHRLWPVHKRGTCGLLWMERAAGGGARGGRIERGWLAVITLPLCFVGRNGNNKNKRQRWPTLNSARLPPSLPMMLLCLILGIVWSSWMGST